jgi:cytochrome d ubiquinol oxidase subunit I
MFSHLDPVFLARAQFAFTVAYHITFPAFTIGLASWLAVVEWRWLKTGNPFTSRSTACGSRSLP